MLKAAVVLLCVCLLAGCGGGSASNFTQPPPTPTPAPTLTGTWSGSLFSAVSGVTDSMSGKFVQGVTNPDGSIQFSGSLSVPSGCISTITINNGNLAGGTFVLSGAAQDGTTINASAMVNAVDTQMNGSWSTVGGSVCASDHGSFTMTKQ